MNTTWAIARHMIAEGIRMKLALVFLVLIGLVVAGLPFTIRGDSSVSGAVQSFMAYAFNATGVLLGMLTIFLSRSVADELVHRQIFLLVTKPVARWQYILGKWLGITVLNIVFLVTAGLTVYGMVHYIKRTHPPIDDRYDAAELENEVLVARHALTVTLPDFATPALKEFERNVEQGRYDHVPDFKPEAEKALLTRKFEARWRVVGPYDARNFSFENVLCDRASDRPLQLRYKTDVSGYPPDEIYRALWQFGDPTKGTRVYQMPVRHIVGRYHTVRFPADAVAEDGTLNVVFVNQNPFAGEDQAGNVIDFRKTNEVQVLFVVGSFEWNMVRLLSLMLCKLMFLGATAILMVSVFSFPVACLASFTVYVFAGAGSFLDEALDFVSDDQATMFTSLQDFAVHSITLLFNMLRWVVPDFARYDAIEVFVNGHNVGLVWLLDGVFWLVCVKTVLVLGLALLLFHRREVAELSF